jgi:WD40 repeat protein
VREVQQRLIIEPILSQLPEPPAIALPALLSRWLYQGYGVGNLLNLAIAAQVSLQGWDLRQKLIAEVNFQGQLLQDTDFRQATFDRCRFSPSLGSILHLVFSPDGQYIAASDSSYQIKIWAVATQQEIALLLGHQGWVWHLQFSPDCRYLLSGSSDRTMRVWDWATGDCLQIITDHQDWVWRVGFGFNKNIVISICADRYLRIWWWRTGRCLLAFRVPDIQVRDGAFHGRRGLLAICGVEGIKIWHVWTGQLRQFITQPEAINLRSLCLSPDGQWLIGAGFDCNIHYWQIDTGLYQGMLEGHGTQIVHLGYDGTGQLLSACLEQVRLWDLTTRLCTQAIPVARDSGRGLAYRSPLLVTGSDNGVVKFWNLATGKCLQTAQGNAPRVMELATNGHNRIVATSKDDGTISLWDFSQLPAIGIAPPVQVYPKGHRGMCTALAFSADGCFLASTGSDRLIRIWDVAQGTVLLSLAGHTDDINQLRFLNTHTLFSYSNDGSGRRWDLTTGTSEILSHPQQQWFMVVDCAPTGGQLALGSITALVRTIDLVTSDSQEFQATGNRLRKLRYSNDGRWLVGITDDGQLNCWDLAAAWRHRCWSIGSLQVTAMVFHPGNSNQLFLATEAGSIAQWDLIEQSCLAVVNAPADNSLRYHHQAISSLCALPHPAQLISCNVAGSIQVWNLATVGLQAVYDLDLPLPYQGMRVAQAQGLNSAQSLTLKQLGAAID